MARPASDLDTDPKIAALATYLREHLNSAVQNETLVGEVITVDAFVAYLETEDNFPLLQVCRGPIRISDGRESWGITIEYVLPSGLGLVLSRPGWLRVVAEEIMIALHNLRNDSSILGRCCTIRSIEVRPAHLAFVGLQYPILSMSVELTGGGGC